MSVSIENNKELLLNNIDKTLQYVNKISEYDVKLTWIFKKPLRLGFMVHLLVLSILLFVSFYLHFRIAKDQSMVFVLYSICFLMASYMFLTFVINKVLVLSKKSDNAKFLKEYPKLRSDAYNSLQNESVIPPTYWAADYLLLIKQYLSDKRADNLKEALNILESELRHNQQMMQLSVIKDQIKELMYVEMWNASRILRKLD
ncbi:hypothetical protein [Paenibacillus radicis (ex Xue et al. 2023)]|uniref:Uncharacterized protein n=1 Tax=Paenibacillus radicis (ex Xue et al. 2023) TaxID=2972489 RepID=A0ABT1YKZ6_9BACL|nr:hypothetical protein [Paenibacillus radicis (ex Xue et al. 2023)]MCR8633672.1 hypothetical protein [Paenibacillus radicis (ex Xue et al. 2023)]